MSKYSFYKMKRATKGNSEKKSTLLRELSVLEGALNLCLLYDETDSNGVKQSEKLKKEIANICAEIDQLVK